MIGWIGVDLDGTLAKHGNGFDAIGEPVAPMLERVKRWIAEGQHIKIMTARACDRQQIEMIREWCKRHGLPALEVTDRKDFAMSRLYDDRAVQVETNTGRLIE